MNKYNFNEKKEEEFYDTETKGVVKLPVWQSPKYLESKKKAIEILEAGKYGVEESDFWILMNKTKTGKMAYTGLIISHNGCLKINDSLEDNMRFDPACLTRTQNEYGQSLVYEYNNPSQGIYEVGEVSPKNCKNDYPFAMAFKRCFDRVVLKNSKLAYAGIYSDSEADEFKERLDDGKADKKDPLDEKLVEELKALGGTVELVATYYKTDIDGVTNEHIKAMVDAKKKALAKAGANA